MASAPRQESPEVLARIYRLFRDYFDKAEKKRRWSLKEDVPWNACNPNLDRRIADVVETFCVVELYLPDYLSKLIPQVRTNRGRAWMLANWGYEECKHSMAFGDWLERSGHRSDEQLADMEAMTFSHEWQLPYDNALGMVIYTMFQERATWLTYQNLRAIVGNDDPALSRVLQLISIDECAHYDFFKRLVQIYLEDDRDATLEQMRVVANTFKMPALHMLADSALRMNEIKTMRILDEDLFISKVYEPILADIDVSKKELRRRQSSREIVVAACELGQPKI
ncbi:MAG: acyl-ACP desaturase [Planctomycetes bacterium]|nr:acyl-ACP desaturase [Planctomycetota bacterium]